MRFPLALAALAGALLAVPAVSAQEPLQATRLQIGQPTFRDPEIVVEKSRPPLFTIRLVREMPTPGWRFVIDEVDVDAEAHRIVARVTAIGPSGIVPQVLTDTELRIPLGSLATGTWLLEVWTRPGTEAVYRPAQALLLDAIP